jgi:hypothetical protein
MATEGLVGTGEPNLSRPEWAAKIRDYLRLHAAGEPGYERLSYTAICRKQEVSRTPLSTEATTCAIVDAVLTEIRDARKAKASAAAVAAVHHADAEGQLTLDDLRARMAVAAKPGLATLDDEAIKARLRRLRGRIARDMRDWAAMHGGGPAGEGPLHDISVAWHDLEWLVWSLRKKADELGALADLWDQRQHETSRCLPVAGVQGPAPGDQEALDL